jgi:hypothetical protein
MTIFVVLHFRRRAGNHLSHVEEIDPEPTLVVSNRKRVYAIKTNYMTHIPHSDLPDPQSSSPPVEQISYLSPFPLDITPSSSTTPRVTRPSAQTPTPPSKFMPPIDNPINPLPLAMTSDLPQAVESSTSTRPATPITLPVVPSYAPAINQSTNEEEALILRLCNLQLPPADVTRVIAVIGGHAESTIEDAQLLWRLHRLNVPPEDINLIVAAVQKRGQSSGVAHDNPRDDTDIGQLQHPDPPGYDFKG